MASPRNNRSLLSGFAGFDTTLRTMFVDAPRAYFEGLRYKLQHLPETNFNLGCDFSEQGKWQDAAFRFRVALYLQPHFPQAWYNLACCQLRMGQRAQARQSFVRSIQQAPGNTDAVFMLSALDPSAVPPAQRPQTMPVEMVQGFFSTLAADYDAVEATNRYQGGAVVHQALKPLVGERTGITVVDLGCGTGIASRPWRPVAKEITGVDFTPAMANAARLVRVADAPLFDKVLEEPLAGNGADVVAADVVLLVNVAQFIGNLQPLLGELGRSMKPGALLALTVEPFAAPGGFGVNIDTGRFGHEPGALRQLVAQAGLKVKQEARVQLYPNFNALLLVVEK